MAEPASGGLRQHKQEAEPVSGGLSQHKHEAKPAELQRVKPALTSAADLLSSQQLQVSKKRFDK